MREIIELTTAGGGKAKQSVRMRLPQVSSCRYRDSTLSA